MYQRIATLNSRQEELFGESSRMPDRYGFARVSQPGIGEIRALFWVANPVSFIGSMKDDSCRTSRKNSLELIELSIINKVSLV